MYEKNNIKIMREEDFLYPRECAVNSICRTSVRRNAIARTSNARTSDVTGMRSPSLLETTSP